MNNLESRFFSVELRAEPESRSVEGLAAIYESESRNLGWFTERIRKGAFKDALQRSEDIVALFNHDQNIILGRTSSGTLDVWESDQGLHYRIKEMPKSREDVYEAIQRGDVTKSSFSFIVKDDDWEERDGKTIRTINEFDVIVDVSPVVHPAYLDTTVAKRSLDEYLIEKREEEVIEEQMTEERKSQLAAFEKWAEGIIKLRNQFF